MRRMFGDETGKSPKTACDAPHGGKIQDQARRAETGRRLFEREKQKNGSPSQEKAFDGEG